MQVHAFLVMVNVPASEWHGLVTDEVQIIGRNEAAQIRIPPQYRIASRRHAKVWADRKGMWVTDVGSSAGTHINGVLLKPNRQYQLRLGDRLWLGGLELDVCREPPVIASEGSGDESQMPPGYDLRKVDGVPAAWSARMAMLGLTHAELEVVLWLSRGVTDTKKLASTLHRSPHTVRTQLNSVYRKLGVHSREELLGWLHANSQPDAEPPAEDTANL